LARVSSLDSYQVLQRHWSRRLNVTWIARCRTIVPVSVRAVLHAGRWAAFRAGGKRDSMTLFDIQIAL
jgi:hypothetical protein